MFIDFRAALAATLVAGASAIPLPASAQAYPSRNVHIIVAYAAGGTGDIVARIVADRLTGALGQTVVVENRAGATGAIGTQSVVSAAPDGHTLLMGQTGEIAITPYWGKGTGYDPAKDLQPVALATVVPLALVAPGNAPYSTVADMLKHKASGTGLSYASAGTGTPGHFAGEFLKLKSKAQMTHVPYKGAGPALNDLLGGHVDFFFSGFPAAIPHVKSGKLKLLAVSSATRSPAAPDTPTVAEAANIPDFAITLWQGFFAPARTPKDAVDRLNAEINKILAEPDIRKKLLDAGANPSPMSVAQFASFVTAEGDKFKLIIKAADIKAQ
jgi:tripartite-type tricarboxylate transporter receptor subunit TctC